MSDPIYRQILSSSFCSCTVQPGCDLIGICVYLCTFVIFSAIKITSVTPLHAKFPLTILNPGSWLNMCLDVESLVSETFNGPKFRTMESFTVTVTANCKLKRVFTLRAPPVEENNPLPNSESLPRNLQLITTSHVSNITQVSSNM